MAALITNSNSVCTACQSGDMLKLPGCGGPTLIPHRMRVSSVVCCVTIKGRESGEIQLKLVSREFAPAAMSVAGSADQNHNGSGSALGSVA